MTATDATTTTFARSVASEIRAHMARAGMTQNQLAIALGWSPAYLSRRLTGAVDLTLAELEAIADALGVTVTELLSPRAA